MMSKRKKIWQKQAFQKVREPSRMFSKMFYAYPVIKIKMYKKSLKVNRPIEM